MLTVINKDLVIKNGLERGGLLDKVEIDSGQAINLSEDCFKFEYDSLGRSLVIKKIDLGLLFKDIDLDLTGLDLDSSLIIPSKTGLNKLDGLVEKTQYGLLADAYILFCSVYGIVDLPLSEVSLGVIEDRLSITVVNSLYYTGTIEVTFKDRELLEYIPPVEFPTVEEEEYDAEN